MTLEVAEALSSDTNRNILGFNMVVSLCTLRTAQCYYANYRITAAFGNRFLKLFSLVCYDYTENCVLYVCST